MYRILIFAFLLLITSPVLADCVSPPGVEGQMVYNTTSQVYQFCNGADQWISMAATAGGGGGGGGGDKALALVTQTGATYPACPTNFTAIGCQKRPACTGGGVETTGMFSYGNTVTTTSGVQYILQGAGPSLLSINVVSGSGDALLSKTFGCSSGYGACVCAASY